MLTPITVNGTPATLIVLSSGSAAPNSRSAVPQPISVTRRFRLISVGVIIRPRSASNVAKSRYSSLTPCTCSVSSSSSRYDTRVEVCACAITDPTVWLNRFTAIASSSVTSGLLRIRSNSSTSWVTPIRVTVNESAPRSETIASDTAAFTPVSNATTVMIDDTATMLPSSVSIDLSLLAQIDASASRIDS